MTRRWSGIVCSVGLLVGLLGMTASPVLAELEPCKGWCIESDTFWFQLISGKGAFRPPDADDQAILDTAPEWLQSVGKYLLEHPSEIAYRAAVLPLKPGADPPELGEHSVSIDWNVGVRLESGEEVWATQWFVRVPNNQPPRTPVLRSVSLTTDLLLPTRDMKTYALIIAFPSTTPNGKEWKDKDIATLIITRDGGAPTSVAARAPGVGGTN